jgi:glycosyltransferase involved in cell wall biosynthesis
MDKDRNAAEPRPSGPARAAARRFDGVICFGGSDWWYHNRGHYDLQMMRELSQHVPVLYVNSIGIRVPRLGEGAMFFRRVIRKLGSLRRGFVRIHKRFAVASPIVVPGATGLAVSKHLLAPQIKLASRRLGIRKPLVWVTCPAGVEVVASLDPSGVVYERTDRWESFPDADAELILGYHRRLQRMADVTLYCSGLLFDEEAQDSRNAAYVDHGVDFERFSQAALRPDPDPPDMGALPRPRAGFVGAVDASTFDPPLFVATARRLSEVHFVLVGASSLPEGWIDLPNVTMLGQKPYEDVASYMAACDVLLMPWNQSDWIQACNPIKLKEYLAVGRPVVSTCFPELRRYEGYVRTATGAEEFASRIREALAQPGDPERLRARVRGETWKAQSEKVLGLLANIGIFPRSATE